MKLKNALLTTATLCFVTIQTANAGLLNGDFESPRLVPTGAVLFAGDPPLTGFNWVVASASVDLVQADWQPASGIQSLDLSGNSAGAMYQDVTFDSSGNWAIKFAMSANPDSPGDKSLRVDFGASGGPLTSLGTFTLNSAGRTHSNMNWVTMTTPTMTVQSGVTYRLEFTSLTDGLYGPTLDNVQLVPVPEPACFSLVGFSLAFLWSVRRRSR